jgi:hypothetical protein
MATEGIQIPPLNAVTPGEVRQAGVLSLLGALCLLAVAAVLLGEAINAAVTADAVFWGGLALGAYIYGLFLLMLAIQGPGYGPASWRLGPWMMIWAGTMYGLATVTLDQAQSTEVAQIVLSSSCPTWFAPCGLSPQEPQCGSWDT